MSVTAEAMPVAAKSEGVGAVRVRGEMRAGLVDEDGLGVLACPQRRHDLACLGEVGVEPGHVLPQNLRGRVPERLPGAVVVEDDRALTIDRDDDVRRALEQLLEVDGREPGSGHA
jgi:hypothetical protein